jgi:DNA-binding transcriptional regulator YdaS (Cro superfamily)
MSAILRACESAGSQAALAKQLNVTPAAVNQWVSGGRPIPAEQCPAIEQATAGSVTCEELRPDEPWSRIPDETWPNPKGRPVLDFAAIKEAA